MKEILPKLWLGSYDDCLDTERLKAAYIKYVLTVMDVSAECQSEYFQYKFIEAFDMETQDLLSHFNDTYEYITRGMNEGGVLVHCLAGLSRSATIVTAYVMRAMCLNPDEALDRVKRVTYVCPNPGFIKQLRLYYNANYKVGTMSPNRFSRLTNFPVSTTGPPGEPHMQFRCKKCRAMLFTDAELVPHRRIDGGSNVTDETRCTDELFVSALAWIDSSKPTGDKIHCPRCACKLGSYTWVGERCVCKAWVVPAFHIGKQRVDLVRLDGAHSGL